MGLTEQILTPVPENIAQKLGRAGLEKLLSLLYYAYQDLLTKRIIQADSHEDSITEEWFICIQLRWKREPELSLIPIPQKPDRTMAKKQGRPPTIDFCFRSEYSDRVYFGTECKLLDEHCKEHLDAYLDNEDGIGRFLNGKYAFYAGAGAMVGYVRQGNPNEVAKQLAKMLVNLEGKPELKKSVIVPQSDQLYETKHNRRVGVSPFSCFHLLFAFNCTS